MCEAIPLPEWKNLKIQLVLTFYVPHSTITPAMAAETLQSGEQPKDPVQEARGDFNKELFAREYTTGALLTKTIRLQNVLLRSPLSAEKVYHELSLVSGQAADKAAMAEDAETAAVLRELQEGFQLTYDTFNSQIQVSAQKPTQPTQTENLPSMARAKGGDVYTRPEPKKPQTEATSPTEKTQQAGSTEPNEETVGSFLRNLRMKAGLSQGKLGKEAGNIQQGIISALERGGYFDENRYNQIISALNLSDEDKQKAQELYNKQFPQNPQQ